MKKVYHLQNCTTCQRILSELNLPSEFQLHNIKENPLSESELEHLYQLNGSYEALFSKRAMLYKELGLKDKNLHEGDYKKYILEHYTFLKRPIIVNGRDIYVGNSKKTVEAVKAALND